MQSDLPLCETQEVGKDNAKFRVHIMSADHLQVCHRYLLKIPAGFSLNFIPQI